MYLYYTIKFLIYKKKAFEFHFISTGQLRLMQFHNVYRTIKVLEFDRHLNSIHITLLNSKFHLLQCTKVWSRRLLFVSAVYIFYVTAFSYIYISIGFFFLESSHYPVLFINQHKLGYFASPSRS